MSILFTLSQAVLPLNTLGYHIFTLYVCSKPFIIIIIVIIGITLQLATKEKKQKTNGDIDTTIDSRARMKHAEPHARMYSVCYG